MNKEQAIKGLEALKSEKKRNFIQRYDLILTFKDLDIKTNPVDSFIVLPHSRGKDVKICAVVGQELSEQSEKECELVIREIDLEEYKNDKKKIKKLAQDYDFFIAQATLMPSLAMVFGRVLGPRNKMPNPKAGCVLPPNANISLVKERLKKTVHVKAKSAPMVQCLVGNEQMSQEEVAENIVAVITAVAKMLPNENQNIKTIHLKKTMSKPVVL